MSEAVPLDSRLRVDDLAVVFESERERVPVFAGVSFEIDEGGFLSLLGPSGCGKSTLLRVVSDLIPPTGGSVTIFGEKPSVARRRRELGFVFQDAALLPWRTARENVELPLEVGGVRPEPETGAPDAVDLLGLVGLAERQDAYPHELSGGMRQRVAIARALITRPRVLLMDEPFGALDEITRDRLNEELLRIWRDLKTTILFVTHSIQEAAFLGQRVLVLGANPGRVREMVTVDLDGPRDLEIRDTPAFIGLARRLRHLMEAPETGA